MIIKTMLTSSLHGYPVDIIHILWKISTMMTMTTSEIDPMAYCPSSVIKFYSNDGDDDDYGDGCDDDDGNDCDDGGDVILMLGRSGCSNYKLLLSQLTCQPVRA